MVVDDEDDVDELGADATRLRHTRVVVGRMRPRLVQVVHKYMRVKRSNSLHFFLVSFPFPFILVAVCVSRVRLVRAVPIAAPTAPSILRVIPTTSSSSVLLWWWFGVARLLVVWVVRTRSARVMLLLVPVVRCLCLCLSI